MRLYFSDSQLLSFSGKNFNKTYNYKLLSTSTPL